MKTVTIDTNVIPGDEIIEICKRKNYEYTCISVTNRELEGTSFEKRCEDIPTTRETCVWGESCWDNCRWGNQDDSNILEEILDILSNGSFPKNRENLSEGYQRMLRDAMILQTHIKEKRNTFITNDERAFIRHDRRKKIEDKFSIRIFTKEEFIRNNS